jgi:phage shock protein C
MLNFKHGHKRVRLDPQEGWLAGVCAGLANYFDTDPAFVRVAVIISALFFPKLTIAAYLIGWLVLDEDRRLS